MSGARRAPDGAADVRTLSKQKRRPWYTRAGVLFEVKAFG
jgi:hypothetical protein